MHRYPLSAILYWILLRTENKRCITSALSGTSPKVGAPQASRCRGRFASSTIAADEHPQAARRFAPHNQRMQQSIPSAN